MLDVVDNLYQNLPEDPWRESFRSTSLFKQLVKRGWKGLKTGQGFYKKEGKKILVLDPETFEYRKRMKPTLPSVERVRHEASTIKRVETLLKSEDKAGAFLWPFFRDIFLYAAERIPEITDESYQIDRAMRWGFNWEFGPFELWQELGVEEIFGTDPPGWKSASGMGGRASKTGIKVLLPGRVRSSRVFRSGSP